VTDKLQIPGPHEHNDFTEIDTSIVLTWAICMLLCIAAFFFFRDRRPDPTPPPPDDPVEARKLELDERTSERAENFDASKFGPKDAVAVFRHGPRKQAETACSSLVGDLSDATLNHEVHLELLKTVDRRSEHAPWTCLLENFLAKKISPDLDVYDELGEFWSDMQQFKAPAEIVASVLEDIRRTRHRPERDAFYSWLRLCALHPQYAAGNACLALVDQLSPNQGKDVLGMVEKHLDVRGPTALQTDMPVIIAGLGQLARQGQPDAWTHEGPSNDLASEGDDDRSFRIGATFVLCRLAHSPIEDVASKAALQLAEVATVAARATDENLLTRWRESCAIAFHRDTTNKGAALAVWNGQAGQAPDYTLAWAEERGDCPARDDRPLWHCGVELWQGQDQALDLAMMGFFTETRYVEWASE
jgi:hypothetical protein